ncbi:hypothetical protein JXE04_03215 [Patescibacteria group bacterium]|nr:hypothetical protein [Patescibacteria group bacterium]
MANLFSSRFLVIITVGLLYLAWPFLGAQAAADLSGRILLQVESKGEAWYVSPINHQRYYLGRPVDAFSVMRNLGLGISEANYAQFKLFGASNLKGRILLRVQANGEAYYVNPLDNKLNYLGRPADAFDLMRRFGLGISNADLAGINISSESALPFITQTADNGVSYHYTWSYNNNPYYLDVKLNSELFKDYSSSSKVYTYFVGSEPADPRAAFYGMFLQLRDDDQETMNILNRLNSLAQSQGIIGDNAMAFIMSFIQYIPYDHEKLESGNNNPYYPFETLYLNKGVCADKTFLAVLWLRSLGYGAAILDFPDSNHSAAGIACPVADSLANSGYCYIETTNYFPVGVVPPNISNGQAVVNQDQLDSLFKADRLGKMDIKQGTSGKLFQGMSLVKAEAARILSLRQELNQAKLELDKQQSVIDVAYTALKLQEAELMSYKNSNISIYNSLVPAYNEAVANYTAQTNIYSKSVTTYNLLVKEFNQSYSSFYQQ